MSAQSARAWTWTRSRGALVERRAKVRTLEARLAVFGDGQPTALDRTALERRVADWRSILRRGPVMARQILRKIFPGVRPIKLVPAEGGGVAFRAAAVGAGVLAGITHMTLVVPPG